MIYGIYPKELEERVRSSKKFIPRLLRNNERLKLFHKYFCLSYGVFKVYDIQHTSHNEYYHIRFKKYGTDMQAVITLPIEDNCYELLRNYDSIENMNILNNDERLFTGAELKFWFIVNNISNKDKRYKSYKKSLIKIDDTSKYYVISDIKNKRFEFIKK